MNKNNLLHCIPHKKKTEFSELQLYYVKIREVLWCAALLGLLHIATLHPTYGARLTDWNITVITHI